MIETDDLPVVFREPAVDQPDADLLSDPDRKTFDHVIQLSFLLEDLLGHSVELLTPEALSPHLGPYRLKEVEYVSVAA